MEAPTLDELKTLKVDAFRDRAEADFNALFVEHPDDVTGLAILHTLASLATGGQVAAQSRQRLVSCRDITPKLRAKCDAVRAATSTAQVETITW